MLIEKDDLLSGWIKRNISPECDAEPTAFAKYVLALLKKDSDEAKLRNICEDQLSVFLGSHTKEFVDSLFVALSDRSYLNSNSQRSASPAAERSDDGDTGMSGNGRSLRRRISPPPREEKASSKERDDRDRRRRSRSPRRRFNGRDRHQRSRTRSRSPHRREERREYRRDRGDRANAAPPTQRVRRRCRDFEEKGLCRRGDNCQYDHGPDPIILDDGNMDNFQPEFTSSNSQSGDATSTPYAPTSAPVATEGYNPEAPALNAPATMPGFIAANFSVPPPPLHMGMPMGSAPFNYGQPMPPMSGPMRGAFRGRGGRRGRFGPYSSERVQPNKSTTIEVRRIPPEINKLGTVNQHFSQFGDITNIQISFDGSPDTALVTFAKLPDAQAAMKSQKPILDNRFIHISWHKPPPPPAPEVTTSENANGLAAILPVIPVPAAPTASETQAIALRARQEAENKQRELRDKRNRIASKKRERVEKNKNFLQLKSNAYHKVMNEYKNILERVQKAADKDKSKLIPLAKQTETIMNSLTVEIRELHELVRKDEEDMAKGIFEETAEKSPSPSQADVKDEKLDAKEPEPLEVKEDEEENVEGDTSITA